MLNTLKSKFSPCACFFFLFFTSVVNAHPLDKNENNLLKKIEEKTQFLVHQKIVKWAADNQLKKYNSDVKLIISPNKFDNIKCDKSLKINDLSRGYVLGNTYFSATCNSPKWESKYRVTVALSVYLPVLRKSVHKGNIINESDIYYKYLPLKFAKSNILSNKENIIGKQARSYVQSNQMINAYQVENKALVKAGEIVTIVSGNKNFQVSMKGEVLTTGGINKQVKVRVLNSTKEIYAYPLSAGVVTVSQAPY